MVVDDEATITTQLEERLTNLGYEVVGSASSGQEAIQLAEQTKPDLILMDIVMPGKIDGIEAAGRIKADLDIPVVFLTAYGDEKFVTRAKQVEAMGYIIKPYQEEELKATIEIALYNKEVARSLSQSETQWRTLAESINDGIILADESSRVIYWNRGAFNIFGYTQEEAIGQPIIFILPQQNQRPFKTMVDQLLTDSETSHYPTVWEDTIGLKKDWSKFPLEISFSTSRIRNRTVLVCLARDVTQRKRNEDSIRTSLKEKEIELNELKKQLQDNLDIIYRLIDLEHEYKKGEPPLTTLQETRERLQSISEIQDRLSLPGHPNRIDFSAYIRNLTGRLYKSYEVDQSQISLTVKSEDIFLPLKTAIPCGLIISELISNSIKYAFPKDIKGEICIELIQRNGEYELTIEDSGIGLPEYKDLHHPGSVGMQMVYDLASQMKAKIQIDKGRGTKFVIIFRETP